MEKISIIIPTYNGEKRITNTLNALIDQDYDQDYEIIVVNDGSTDGTIHVVQGFGQHVKLINQKNQGPAAARNNGAAAAEGEIILFTDDDCIPASDWIEKMTKPFFIDPDLTGVKGIYKTDQTELTARFVQLEYEDKYSVMAKQKTIDFIDTYSAGYRRKIFLDFNGFDTSFPVACAEDVDLSYRMSVRGCKMIFVPEAVVTHIHPSKFKDYIKKKYKFAFWRMMAVKKTPEKFVSDSHTPQLMKLQLLLVPFMTLGIIGGMFFNFMADTGIISFCLMGISTMPFTIKAYSKDRAVSLTAPFFLTARTFSQFTGIIHGIIYILTNKNNMDV